MVVVVLTAAGALLALRGYNSTKQADPERLERTLHTVKQQAGVLAAICTAIFSVITALQSAKLLGANQAQQGVPQQWGKRQQDARVIDIVDRVG